MPKARISVLALLTAFAVVLTMALATASMATGIATSNPAPIVAGQPVTITANLGSPGVNFYVPNPVGWPAVTWGTNCHLGYQSGTAIYEVCHDTFTFTVAAAPPAGTGTSYPLQAGYWYGISRGKPSYTRPVTYMYLDTLY